MVDLTDQLRIELATFQLGLGLSSAIKGTMKPKFALVNNVTFRIHKTGFPFQFLARGGNGPPPEGGDTRRGIRSHRGGNGA